MKSENKKNRYILPIFIVFIMVASGFAVIFSSPSQDSSESYKHKGILFMKKGGGWVANVQGFQLYLTYGPRDLSEVEIDPNVYELLKAEKIYYSINSGDFLGNSERDLFYNLKPAINSLTKACLADSEECKELPLKTCEDADDKTKIIVLKLSEGNRVRYESNCYIIEGNSDYLTKAVDKLVLTLFGVI